MYLDDIYGDQEILRDGGVIPRRLITSCEHFHREAVGINPPNGVRIHVAGIDLVRDAQGTFRVLEDNLRSPSGVSYVMENRRTMARVFPNLFATHRVRAVGDYASHLLRALRKAAASNEADPTVVVLTPPVCTTPRTSSIRCWPARWVSSWSRAATCSAVTTPSTCAPPRVSGRSMSSTAASMTTFWTPMVFKPDSMLGVAGVLNAARAGNVVISSAVGNGVGDDKLVYTYVPTIIEYYLGEKPLVANVDTFRCWLDDEREEVLDRVDELVIKPVEAPVGTASCSARTPRPRNSPRSPRRSAPIRVAGSLSRSYSCRPSRLASATNWCPGTSTCDPSRSTTVTTCGCCPAD